MARGRIKGDHDTKRAQIAEAACKVFLRHGLAQSSLADIAREMGYTTGVLRHYFADKEELLLYAKNRQFDQIHLSIASVAESGLEGLEKLRASAAELLPSNPDAIDNFRLLAMFNGSAVGDAALTSVQHKRNESHAALFSEMISQLRKQGLLAQDLNPKLEASALLALIDGLAEQQIMRPQPWSRETLTGLLNRHIDSLARPRSTTARR
jgi:AcrR family transcriptional regulator